MVPESAEWRRFSPTSYVGYECCSMRSCAAVARLCRSAWLRASCLSLSLWQVRRAPGLPVATGSPTRTMPRPRPHRATRRAPPRVRPTVRRRPLRLRALAAGRSAGAVPRRRQRRLQCKFLLNAITFLPRSPSNWATPRLTIPAIASSSPMRPRSPATPAASTTRPKPSLPAGEAARAASARRVPTTRRRVASPGIRVVAPSSARFPT
jgi:hypothetical protein